MSYRAVSILSDDLGKRLERKAKSERRSISQTVALLLEDALTSCPVCGCRYDDDNGTEHECPPGFS